MKTIICNECGRTLEQNFVYCPWCGQSRSAVDHKASLDSVFLRLEAKQNEERQRRLEEMNRRLAELEKELDVLVLSNEMAK